MVKLSTRYPERQQQLDLCDVLTSTAKINGKAGATLRMEAAWIQRACRLHTNRRRPACRRRRHAFYGVDDGMHRYNRSTWQLFRLGSRPNLRTELIPTIALRGWSKITHIKSNMAAGGHLEKWKWRHNSADDHPITTKFGRQMQNGMPMTIHRSKSKPEIEFQYGGNPFTKTGSSYISAVDWAILSKFGMQINFHLPKHITSLNVKPEVHFRRHGAILNNQYDVITPPTIADDRPTITKFGR